MFAHSPPRQLQEVATHTSLCLVPGVVAQGKRLQPPKRKKRRMRGKRDKYANTPGVSYKTISSAIASAQRVPDGVAVRVSCCALAMMPVLGVRQSHLRWACVVVLGWGGGWFQCPPSATPDVASLDVEVSRVAIYFKGNYAKFARNVSQTPWYAPSPQGKSTA